ncbi:hypothetical protein [Pseudomonas syringae group genomosp. 3]|uniref:hypothetical protein n=1 Tax=Pseudomonas syringae group genomosp. 3 TaxID=251701 RepID=UPI000EFFA8E4|nr:hypothetical protein [Pseudomonas syringae group genomosp. 3]
MSLRSSLQRARSVIVALLRLAFEDKEMKGHDFSHLKARGRSLYIDEDSDAYRSMLPDRLKEARVDNVGYVILPHEIRKELSSSDLVEYWAVDSEMYVITVMKQPD